jgi:hypothetical protein
MRRSRHIPEEQFVDAGLQRDTDVEANLGRYTGAIHQADDK